MGDMIVLIQGSKEFLDGLRPFPEDFRFKLSPAWSLTLKGGVRAGQADSERALELSDVFGSLIMDGSADEKMEQSRKNMKPDEL